MDLIDVELDDNVIFQVQKRMSFNQQNELMELIEDFIDLAELQVKHDAKKDIENKDLTMADFKEVLKPEVKFTTFSFKLTKFCLLTFVKTPKITEAMLDDPDDPNTDNFSVLGGEIVGIAFEIIAERALLKKTQMK